MTNEDTGGYQIYRIQDTDVYQDMTNEDGVGLSFLSISVKQGGAFLRDEIPDLHCFEQKIHESDQQSTSYPGQLR